MTTGSNYIRLSGRPSPRQKEFFSAHRRFIAYGGARGGGKSWALRRKLIYLALKYPGISMLFVRRTLPELRENHIIPMINELGALVDYSEVRKTMTFRNGSRILFGYLDADRDLLRYQGMEFDIIAIDEATQLTENQFVTLKATLRGVNVFPKRIYLTCNPGGVGHSWVKRLFVERKFRERENPDDYIFIPARIYDNKVLTDSDPGYLEMLRSLPAKMRSAWLDGNWDVFEGQYFPEFSEETHILPPRERRNDERVFAALDYGFDTFAAVWLREDREGNLFVYREYSRPGLTLSEAAEHFVRENRGDGVEFIAASPDLWNRRQDSGKSGVMIMSETPGMPPLIKADNRRIIGWRTLREYLRSGAEPALTVSSECIDLPDCIKGLLHDRKNPEDVSSEPHSITHLPEALRYAVMAAVGRSEPAENGYFDPFLSWYE
ncbi:MAG: phage terminase large subunit [Clostridia bacterium]|nr:phage terminase large subunit [Clostridia bacterium]